MFKSKIFYSTTLENNAIFCFFTSMLQTWHQIPTYSEHCTPRAMNNVPPQCSASPIPKKQVRTERGSCSLSQQHLQQGSFWSISVASSQTQKSKKICMMLFVWATWQGTGSGHRCYGDHRSTHQPFSNFFPKSPGQDPTHNFVICW